MSNEKPRVVSGTVINGRATFNQVTLLHAFEQPKELVLVAIDPSTGVRVWRADPAVVNASAREQHRDYSRQLSSVDPEVPPPYLGVSEFTPKAEIDPALWYRLTSARTNGLKKAAEDFLGL